MTKHPSVTKWLLFTQILQWMSLVFPRKIKNYMMFRMKKFCWLIKMNQIMQVQMISEGFLLITNRLLKMVRLLKVVILTEPQSNMLILELNSLILKMYRLKSQSKVLLDLKLMTWDLPMGMKILMKTNHTQSPKHQLKRKKVLFP